MAYVAIRIYFKLTLLLPSSLSPHFVKPHQAFTLLRCTIKELVVGSGAWSDLGLYSPHQLPIFNFSRLLRYYGLVLSIKLEN